MLFEEPAPRLSGEKWGRGPKRTDESAHEDVRFGDRSPLARAFTISAVIKWKF
jgi:hypothetical protein